MFITVWSLTQKNSLITQHLDQQLTFARPSLSCCKKIRSSWASFRVEYYCLSINYDWFSIYLSVMIFYLLNKLKWVLRWISFIDDLIIKSCNNSLLVLAVTLTNSPGHHYFTLAFGTPNLKTLFLGALLIIISWVMLKASKIYDQQKFTI